MAPQSHAQFREDVQLHALFSRHGQTDADVRAPGVCVEVGGHDGRSGSMSLYFERLGWTCLVVEPIPALAGLIRRTRSCLVAEAAADDKDGEAELLVPVGSETFATLDNANTARSRIGEHRGEVTRYRVRTRRLDDLMTEAGLTRVDFISIDVEGNELNVLKGLTLDHWQPRFLIVEDNSFGRDRSVYTHLAAEGYHLMRISGVNHWYCRHDDPALTAMERGRCAIKWSLVRIYGILSGRGRHAR